MAAWFAERHGTRSIGAGYGEAFEAIFVSQEVTARLYDALLYVDSTTTARANPGGRRPPSIPLVVPVNLDFEEVDSAGRPVGWSFNTARLGKFDLHVTVAAGRAASGERSVLVQRANATTLTIGFALVGDGRAWVDAVSVETLP